MPYFYGDHFQSMDKQLDPLLNTSHEEKHHTSIQTGELSNTS